MVLSYLYFGGLAAFSTMAVLGYWAGFYREPWDYVKMFGTVIFWPITACILLYNIITGHK